MRPGAILAALLLLGGCDGSGQPAPQDMDPLSVPRSQAPHDALVCPPGTCAAQADRPSPAYPVPPDELLAAWAAAVEAAPRTAILRHDPGQLLLLAQQRSAVLGFVDNVAVRVLPAGQGSTFAAYSRSELGWWDLGVNAARLQGWQRAAEERLREAMTRPSQAAP